jgi:hypothetical protein
LKSFTLTEIANIMGVPRSRLHNWTAGRPLRLRASVLPAKGKGNHALYSYQDLKKFVIINELTRMTGMRPGLAEHIANLEDFTRWFGWAQQGIKSAWELVRAKAIRQSKIGNRT